MPKSLVTHAPTKRRLLDAAQRLMLAQGFAGTSVEEICEAAKLTKGSFFHHFASKESLGRELLERYCAASEAEMRAVCCPAEGDPLARLEAFLDGMVRLARSKDQPGCLLGTLAQELSDTHPEIRSVCAAGFAQWTDVLRRVLEEAKAAYAPRSALRPADLADHVLAVVQGATLLARTRRDPKVVERSLGEVKRYLLSLFRARRG